MESDKTSHAGSDEMMMQLVDGMNEIVLIIDDNRRILAASATAREKLGIDMSGDDAADVRRYFPSVFIDAIFSRAQTEKMKDRSMTFNVVDSHGTNICLETRFNWIDMGSHEVLVLTCRDVNYYMQTISKLTAREDLYRTIFHESPLGFIHINSDGIIADCNQEFTSIFDYDREDVIGLCVAEPQKEGEPLEQRFRKGALDAIIGIPSTFEDTFVAKGKHGKAEGWVRVSFSPIVSDTNSFLGAVGIVENITEAKAAEQKIAYIGTHDALTGLMNRHACSTDMAAIDRPEFFPVGIIYIDLNHLKLANDAFGHHEGDELLRKCSSIIEANATANDTCYRLGGDEFVMLLRNISRSNLRTRVNSINKLCQSWKGDGLIQPSMAIGSAIKLGGGQDINETMKEAEDIMYANKLRNGPSVRKRLMTTLEAKLAALRDGAVGRRGSRMSMWADWLLKNYAMPPETDKKCLQQLFRYHDIGLLGFVGELKQIAENPMRRTNAASMQHMVVGYRIARTVAELGPIAEMILFHHEHWDGSGGPSQSKGDEIPYLSRLIAIFDSIEGMRCLRDADTRPEFGRCLSMIEAAAGTIFDPGITATLIPLLRQSPPSFASEMNDNDMEETA